MLIFGLIRGLSRCLINNYHYFLVIIKPKKMGGKIITIYFNFRNLITITDTLVFTSMIDEVLHFDFSIANTESS